MLGIFITKFPFRAPVAYFFTLDRLASDGMHDPLRRLRKARFPFQGVRPVSIRAAKPHAKEFLPPPRLPESRRHGDDLQRKCFRPAVATRLL
jgi:hypothetical protein